MQKWEYKIFGSHLDPAELVVLFDECGREGWELVGLAAVSDHLPAEIMQHEVPTQESIDQANPDEAVPVEAFRYIFKRPLP